jgi:hypothetical protein
MFSASVKNTRHPLVNPILPGPAPRRPSAAPRRAKQIPKVAEALLRQPSAD